MSEVLVIELEGRQERRRLSEGRLSIGRGTGNDWVIQDPDPTPTLSRRHCVLEARGERFTVTDLGSTNGTLLNEKQVPPNVPTPVTPGDRIRLGRYILRVALERPAREAGMSAGLGNGHHSAPKGGRAPAVETRSLDDILGDFGAAESAPEPPPEQMPKPSLDDDPLGDLFAEPVPRPRPRPMPPPRDVGDTQGDHTPPHLESFRLEPPPWPRPSATELFFEEGGGEDVEETTQPPPSAAPARKVPPREEVASPPPAPAAQGDPSRALVAFLEGAGLAPGDVGAADPELFFRNVGFAFAAMAEGLRSLLAARALVKDHAGLERTRLRSSDNNPLKYSATSREAVLALLRQREMGYLPPRESIEMSLRDLRAHELAILEGLRAALKTVLERFDPKELEAQLDEASAVAVLLQGGRRAKLWELYTERYAEIAEAARRKFIGAFDEAFREAYGRKVREFGMSERADFRT
jgi:type VI secretion system FHA domain protein